MLTFWAHKYVLAMLVLALTARHADIFACPGPAGKAKQACVCTAFHACSDVQQAPWHVKAALRQN